MPFWIADLHNASGCPPNGLRLSRARSASVLASFVASSTSPPSFRLAQARHNFFGNGFYRSACVVTKPVIVSRPFRAQAQALIRREIVGFEFSWRNPLAPVCSEPIRRAFGNFNNESASPLVELEGHQVNAIS
jgi:hypothetical protein